MGQYAEQFLFGFIDGINGAVGLVIALSATGTTANVILIALMSRAFSSAVSMAGAEYESGGGDRRQLAGKTAAMGVGYLTSALLPGLGFAINLQAGQVVFAAGATIVLAIIAWFRHRTVGWPRAILTTLVIFVLAVCAGLLASLVG